MLENVDELYKMNFGKNWKMFKDFYDDYNQNAKDEPFSQEIKQLTFISLQGTLEAIADKHVGATRYEHSFKRRDHRNGYDPQDVKIAKIGTLRILRPLVRNRPKELARLLPFKELPEAFGDFVADLLLSGLSAEERCKILPVHSTGNERNDRLRFFKPQAVRSKVARALEASPSSQTRRFDKKCRRV